MEDPSTEDYTEVSDSFLYCFVNIVLIPNWREGRKEQECID